MRAFSVARELSNKEEWSLDQSSYFEDEITEKQRPEPKKLPWVLFLVKFMFVARVLNTTEERRRGFF